MHLLPYRTDPGELRRYLLALARGRTRAQLRDNEFSPKTLDGVAAAADALGLTAEGNGTLSPLGRRLATASGDAAREVVAEIVRGYDPYAGVIEAAREAGGETSLDWVQQWWDTQGFGTSDSNRYEAAPVFARFVEAAGYGRFVQGRKGRTSRIVWEGVAERNGSEPSADPARHAAEPALPDERRAYGGPNRLSWEISPGRCMSLELPPELTEAERAYVHRVIAALLDPG